MSDDRTPGRDPEAGAKAGFEPGTDVQSAELKAGFEALRDEVRTRGRVPDFHVMMERARAEVDEGADDRVVPMESARRSEKARRDLMRLGRWIPVAAAAAVAGLLLFGGETGGDDEFERLVADYSVSAASWRSPTASLMDIPGVDLGAVPSFGSPLIDVDISETTSDEGRDI